MKRRPEDHALMDCGGVVWSCLSDFLRQMKFPCAISVRQKRTTKEYEIYAILFCGGRYILRPVFIVTSPWAAASFQREFTSFLRGISLSKKRPSEIVVIIETWAKEAGWEQDSYDSALWWRKRPGPSKGQNASTGRRGDNYGSSKRGRLHVW